MVRLLWLVSWKPFGLLGTSIALGTPILYRLFLRLNLTKTLQKKMQLQVGSVSAEDQSNLLGLWKFVGLSNLRKLLLVSEPDAQQRRKVFCLFSLVWATSKYNSR